MPRRLALAPKTPRRVVVPTSSLPVKVEPPRRMRVKYPFVGYIDFQGLDIDIENRAGSVRRGVDGDGHPWSVKMAWPYGEIRGVTGVDKDRLDVYIGPHADSPLVVVVHQNDPVTRNYDEDKVMLGFATVPEAVAAYRKQYDRPGFYGGHDAMSIGEFRRWAEDRRNSGRRIKAEG